MAPADMTAIPRSEHPRPQFFRDQWLNLNGRWRFDFDFGASGVERGIPADPSSLSQEILVPFCPESSLSGIGHTDFIPCAWYHRTFSLPENWTGDRVFLHFGAVDYDCQVWLNGEQVGRHRGGSASFSFDITDALADGENDLVVCATDDVRSGTQPSGKQSAAYGSRGCHYTRVTGIWQTVWLESRPATHLTSARIVPDLDGGRLVVTPTITGARTGLRFRATVTADGTAAGAAEAPAGSGSAVVVQLANPRPWSPTAPFLYDVRLELVDGETIVDSVASYAGLRKFHIEGNRFYLNNEPFFFRSVLDQGFYPDGIWTAPSDAELKADIERAKAVGFNGARLHQKVFEERFHYWADQLGYITWGEFCDWGAWRQQASLEAFHNLQNEWREVVMRDLNHPSIVAWTPYNETAEVAKAHIERHRRCVQETVDLTRALDPTRPVNDCSGYVHVDTDIYTVHCYDQDVATFAEKFTAVAPGAREGFHVNVPELDAPYAGQPYVVDEYGGTWWREEIAPAQADPASWGYGKPPEGIEEVYARIAGLTKVLTDHPHIAGYTYTQLTDVEQEQNGIYTYDRQLKFDAERLRAIFGAPAASEGEESP